MRNAEATIPATLREIPSRYDVYPFCLARILEKTGWTWVEWEDSGRGWWVHPDAEYKWLPQGTAYEYNYATLFTYFKHTDLPADPEAVIELLKQYA